MSRAPEAIFASCASCTPQLHSNGQRPFRNDALRFRFLRLSEEEEEEEEEEKKDDKETLAGV